MGAYRNALIASVNGDYARADHMFHRYYDIHVIRVAIINRNR